MDTHAENVNLSNDEMVSLGELSDMTGFPKDFIKKELMVGDEDFSIEDLRKTALQFLKKTMES